MTNVTRRDFLSQSGGLLVAGGAASSLKPTQVAAESHDGPTQKLTLTADWLETTLDGTPVKLRAWNGTVPGPVVMTQPGERLEIDVVNNLTPYDSSAWAGDHNVPHDLNHTNLHMHGLEVAPHLFTPLGTSDPHAPMIAIPPEGGSLNYTFDLPHDQPPGLFWYHPHKHGSTAVQAVSGMAGATLVRGNIDEVPQIKAARDIILAVEDIGLFPTDHPERDGEGTYIYEPDQNTIWQTFGGNVTRYDPATGQKVDTDLKGGFTTGDYALRYFLISVYELDHINQRGRNISWGDETKPTGRPFYKEVHNPKSPTSPTGTQLEVPEIRVARGEVVRFRLLNANSDNVMPIYVEEHDLHLIGMDGVNLPKTRLYPARPAGAAADDYQLLLAPANRAEWLIKASNTPGTYNIMQSPQSLQFLESTQRVLMKIVVEDREKDMDLPEALPVQTRHYPLIRDDEVVKHRVMEFGMQFPGVDNKVVGIDFFMNNMLYEELSVPTTVIKDTAEEWVIKAPPHPGGNSSVHPISHFDNTEGHPFHIHVNSFEVVATATIDSCGNVIDEKWFEPDEILIQDTIWVPMGSQVTIRQKYKQWTGKAVFHCHILPHEDTGMMQNFTILDPAQMPGHHRMG